MKPGRNEPCHCGSGKKYKKCCMEKETDNPIQYIKKELQALIDSGEFGSMEELQSAIQQFNREQNTASIDDFHGLSSEQMHAFLYAPFESPQLVSFPPVLETEPDTEAAFLLDMLVREIGENGMKLTAKGNLGRKFCQQAFQQYLEHYPDHFLHPQSIRQETDFDTLHAVRLTAQNSGLVRKNKGKMLLSVKCRKALERDGMRALYPLFFHAYTRKFNWAYRDGYQEIAFIQHGFLFTLYLLHRYGDTWQPATFYSDSFRQAFPMLLQEVEPSMFDPPEKVLESCYILRSIQRFACFFGLAELKASSTDTPRSDSCEVRATPLLNEIVRFLL